jgi:transcriptional regulator with AAA-type ATPase domain
MTDVTQGSGETPSPAPEGFRWQLYFQKSTEPLFFLNRHRRLLFANHAWESLTGVTLREVRGQACRRRAPGADANPAEAVCTLLAPPAEVMSGQSARVRRLVPPAVGGGTTQTGPRWWDMAFFPLGGDGGLLGILGKIAIVPREGLFENQPLPEKIVALRERLADEFSLDHLVADSLVMQRVREQVRLASQVHVPVSLVGERGTGKRWLARCIHRQSPRRDGVFAVIDCVRLPQQALAEALFGESGLLRRQQLGSLYLHEPGHLPREMQDRLVRLAGAMTEAEQDAPALLAGFSADPEADLRSGRLLAELYSGLTTVVIAVPPVRERLADFDRLADTLLERARIASDKGTVSLAEGARAILRSYGWPANIAELYRVLVDSCLRAQGERIEADDLPFHLHAAPMPQPKPISLDAVLEKVERRLMILALRHARNNKTEAAELLSIWRPRLIRRMAALGITDGP